MDDKEKARIIVLTLVQAGWSVTEAINATLKVMPSMALRRRPR